MTNLLERRALGFSSAAPLLSSRQGKMDALLSDFSEGMADVRAVASFTAGGFAYQAGKWAALAGVSRSAILARWAAPALGLASEVAAFQGVQHLSRASGAASESSFFDAKAWGGTALDISLLKFAGFACAGGNAAFAHFAQANALVWGREISEGLGFAESLPGDYLQKLLGAEVSNLQMRMSLAFLHHGSGGKILISQRALEAKASARQIPFSNPFLLPPRDVSALANFQAPSIPAERSMEGSLKASEGGNHRVLLHLFRPERLLGMQLGDKIDIAERDGKALSMKLLGQERNRRKKFLVGEGLELSSFELEEAGIKGHWRLYLERGRLSSYYLEVRDHRVAGSPWMKPGAGSVALEWLMNQAAHGGYGVDLLEIVNPRIVEMVLRQGWMDPQRSRVESGVRERGSGDYHTLQEFPLSDMEQLSAFRVREYPQNHYLNIRGHTLRRPEYL